jgi:short-subunit dehydrogenase
MGLGLDGATVLLTGASSGIGAATVPRLAARGVLLGLVARRADRLIEVGEAAMAAGAAQVEIWPCDLGDLDAAERVARDAEERLGGIDVLINNAGMPKRRAVQALTPAEVDETLRVNFLAPVRLTLALLPAMLARGRGCVVNVSSLGGRLGIRQEAAYSASKFALCGWSESMAADLWGTGVEIRLILPGPVDTEIWDRPGNDPAHYHGPLEPPSVVAETIVAAVEGDTVEHYVPDLRSVVEFKTTDLNAFIAGMVAGTDEMRGEGPSA